MGKGTRRRKKKMEVQKTFLQSEDWDYRNKGLPPVDPVGIRAVKRMLPFDEEEEYPGIIGGSSLEEISDTVGEKVQVFVRVKPKVIKDNPGDENVIEIDPACLRLIPPKESQTYKTTGSAIHTFSFTKIFKPDTSQSEFFKSMVLPRLREFLEGSNQLIFTYGASSSGKTFTLQGSTTQPGVLPRSLDVIFNSIKIQKKDSSSSSSVVVAVDNEELLSLRPYCFNGVQRLSNTSDLKTEKEGVLSLGQFLKKENMKNDVHSSDELSDANLTDISGQSLFPGLSSRIREDSKVDLSSEDIHYSIWISFAEIYNENIFDLLEKVPVSRGKKAKRTTLKLAEDRKGAVYIKGLKEILVNSADEAYQLLLIGRENLQFATTKLNHNSSRSHCIFTIKVIRVVDPQDPKLARVNILSFCDLAGSERIKKTLNTGVRQKEAGNINSSLLVLSRVIKVLRTNQALKDSKKHNIVPFRDSKLTRLFQTFFTGLGKASMIVNVSQSSLLFDETIQVMKFAAETFNVTCAKEEVFKHPQRRVSRFSSIMNEHLRTSLQGRGSIAWENPKIRSTMCYTTYEEEDEDQEEECEDEPSCSIIDDKYKALTDLIENLQAQLQDEKHKNLTLESSIRTELCKEFDSMMVSVESGWKKRLQDTTDRIEELSEWRISKLESAYEECKRKKKKVIKNDKYLIDKVAALQSELESAELRLEDSEKQKEAYKKTHNLMNETCQKYQEEITSLKFTNEQLKLDRGKTTEDYDKLKAEIKSKDEALESLSANPIIKDLQGQISDLKKKNSQKTEEIKDFKALLDEAGDEFISKDKLIKSLEDKIHEYKETLAQKSVCLRDAQNEVQSLLTETNVHMQEKEALEDSLCRCKKEKNDLLNEKCNLLKELAELKENKLNGPQDLESRFYLKDSLETEKELKKRIEELEDENIKIKNSFVDLKDENEAEISSLKSTLQTTMETSEAILEKNSLIKYKLSEAQKELETLKSSKSSFKVPHSKVNKNNQSVLEFESLEEKFALENEIETFKENLNDKENSLDILVKDKSELEGKIKSLESLVKEKEFYISQLETIVIEKDSEITDLEAKLDSVNIKKEPENEEEEENIVKEQILVASNERDITLAKIVELEKTLNETEKSLKKVKDEKNRREKELNDEIETIRTSKLKLKASDDDKSKQLSDKDKEIGKLEKEIKCLIQAEKGQRDIAESHLAEINMLRSQIKKFSEETNDTEVLGKRIAEQQGLIEKLNLQIKVFEKDEDTVSVLKKELDLKNEEKARLLTKISELESNTVQDHPLVTDLQEKIALLESQLEASKYQINKTREEREEIMTRYSKLLKSQGEELAREKQESIKLRDVVLKSTPKKEQETLDCVKLKEELDIKEKTLNELKDKIIRIENEEKDEEEKLRFDVDRLTREISKLKSLHTKELAKLKKANEKIIKEYKEANVELQKQIGITGMSRLDDVSSNSFANSNNEADVSEHEKSIESSIVYKKKKRGRGARKGGTTSVIESLGSSTIEDNSVDFTENVENSKKPTRVTRSRPVRKTKINSTYTAVDTENGSILPPVTPLKEVGVNESLRTPAMTRTGRKTLYTPGYNEVFTPSIENGDSSLETPHSIVKRQLRSRKKK